MQGSLFVVVACSPLVLEPAAGPDLIVALLLAP